MLRTAVAAALVLLGIGCAAGPDDAVPDGGTAGGPDAATPPPADAGVDGAPPFPVARCGETRAPLPPLVEDRRVYQQETLGVWEAHVTITDLDDFAAVNANIPGASVPVIFREGDFGAGAREPNGVLSIRGGFSRLNAQKNYKIQLDDGAGRWRGQKEINLNKHMTDLTRIRNKMSFDFFQSIPDLTSLRTQFVHLTVNDEDYGLYTWIEEPDHRFLESHGLDPDGSLYKAVLFNFQAIDPAIASDPDDWRMIVEAKANPDDAKFLRMVAAVNDPNVSPADLIATYFNRDNLITWAAVNVLLNDVDVRTQNYYLYSPSTCEGWYILPWDYDGAWGFYAQLTDVDRTRQRWEAGLANYWPMHLFKRFLSDPANVAAVDAKLRELASTRLTDAATAAAIARYHDLVLPYIARNPDLAHLPGHYAGAPDAQGVTIWEGELARITSTTSRYLAEYDQVLERPMPVFLGDHTTNGVTTLSWDRSFDLQHDPIVYDFQLATAPDFSPASLVMQDLGTTEDDEHLSNLAPGTYDFRVVIRDTHHADAWQLPYDDYRTVTVP
ncbi:MAG TPA: CotH kinase family protein [Kofleriaceae bacterium]|nr:CotH kinase family protein [Kofleriaceae bacterium]